MTYLLGHLVGDYLLQNDWMALNKKTYAGKGWLACTVHCLLYSLSVCLFTGWWDWRFLLVFVTHFALDKTMIVVWYMNLTGSFRRIISDKNNPSAIWAYAIVDNTFHLVTLYLISMI
jgi:hypothetical protein